MHLYESCVILSAQIPENELEGYLEKLTQPLTAGGAEIKKIAQWGKRRLAYPIEKQSYGFYVVLFFTLENATEPLENFYRLCRYDESILRQITFTVPTSKKGHEIHPLVPEPGYLSEFTMAARPRRGGGPRRHAPHMREATPEGSERGSQEGPAGQETPAGQEAPATPDAPAATATEEQPGS